VGLEFDKVGPGEAKVHQTSLETIALLPGPQKSLLLVGGLLSLPRAAHLHHFNLVCSGKAVLKISKVRENELGTMQAKYMNCRTITFKRKQQMCQTPQLFPG
jgi:hypothetical protein